MSVQNIIDAKLLTKACNKKSKKAAERLYQKLKLNTNSYFHKSCDKKNLDDNIQELFVRLSSGKLNYKGNGNPDTFLQKTLKNISHENHNNNKLKPQPLQVMEDNGIFPADKNSRIPLQNLEINERNQIMIAAITDLSPKSRQAIELVYFDGISAKQAAELIKCDFKLFRNRLKYALNKLNKSLKKYFLT